MLLVGIASKLHCTMKTGPGGPGVRTPCAYNAYPSAVITITILATFLAFLVLSCGVSYTHGGSNCVLHPFCVNEAHRNTL
jgi:hypothetical protein